MAYGGYKVIRGYCRRKFDERFECYDYNITCEQYHYRHKRIGQRVPNQISSIIQIYNNKKEIVLQESVSSILLIVDL